MELRGDELIGRLLFACAIPWWIPCTSAPAIYELEGFMIRTNQSYQVHVCRWLDLRFWGEMPRRKS
jgi:hypothetical protein